MKNTNFLRLDWVLEEKLKATEGENFMESTTMRLQIELKTLSREIFFVAEENAKTNLLQFPWEFHSNLIWLHFAHFSFNKIKQWKVRKSTAVNDEEFAMINNSTNMKQEISAESLELMHCELYILSALTRIARTI